jgi:hypothetical protein
MNVNPKQYRPNQTLLGQGELVSTSVFFGQFCDVAKVMIIYWKI